MVFKVPSLRNVEKTAPYFHDGSAATLDKAVEEMAEYQLGRELKDEEVREIVSWLKTLTGNPPLNAIRQPEGRQAADARAKPGQS